jgi:glyoxylase-like metal-dependent hydrolase (beta-lactamase superfamily II)
MNIQRITDHLSLVEGNNGGRFPFSHSFLISDEETALVDTGCGLDVLQELKKKEKVDFIINSHSHADHSAGNCFFAGIPLHVPREEFEFSGNLMKLSLRYAEGEFQEIWRGLVQTFMGFKDSIPTHAYADKDVFNFGETRLEALHTPGHTIGHYCFFMEEEGILLSSDIDFTEFGPWYGNEESEILDFKNSIEKMRSLRPSLVVSSHKGIIRESIDSEFKRYYAKFEERNNIILSLLGQERSLSEIVDMAPIYGRKSFAGIPLEYWERKMIEKHLALLVREGKILKKGERFERIE